MSVESPPITLQPTEVAGTSWVPLRYFLSPMKKPVEVSLSEKLVGKSPSITANCMRSVAQLVGDTFFFPGCILPKSDEVVSNKMINETLNYHLWGLTLSITEDLLVTAYILDRGELHQMDEKPTGAQLAMVKAARLRQQLYDNFQSVLLVTFVIIVLLLALFMTK